MAATEAPPRDDLARRRAAPAVGARRKWQPVEWWALLGAAWLAFWAYVLVSWVTGPYFTHVDPGPTALPDWMRVLFTAWQAAAFPIVATVLFVVVVRPWRRDRRIPFDGLLIIGYITMCLQDPGSNYFGVWYTTNAHLVNMGSFVNEIPGWLSFGAPGAQPPFMPLLHLLEYPLGMFCAVWVGSAVVKRLQRTTALSPVALMAICYPFMMVMDLVIEGAFMLLGFYTMAGGHASISPDAYNKFPLIEPVFVALIWLPVVALRVLKNDKGETFVERGADSLRVSPGRRDLYRGLAAIAACQMIYLCCYNIPVATYMGAKPGVWPKTVQETSYFTDNLCGPSTGRLCPGPGIPLTSKTQVAPGATGVGGPTDEYADRGAGVAAARRQVIPFSDEAPVPFVGRVLGERSR
jgi:hypothetical protein